MGKLRTVEEMGQSSTGIPQSSKERKTVVALTISLQATSLYVDKFLRYKNMCDVATGAASNIRQIAAHCNWQH